jgi:hypothetical protein
VTRVPQRRADDVAAYAYRAELRCPLCVVDALIVNRVASPAARDMAVAEVLDQCADAMAIDRDDETTFGADEFSKRVFVAMLGPRDRCISCHRPF